MWYSVDCRHGLGRFNPPPRRGRGGILRCHGHGSLQRRRFNPPPRRGRGGIVVKSSYGATFYGFNPPPRRGRGGIRPSSESTLPPAAFQSAAASWTRRNANRTTRTTVVYVFQSAAASWTRRNYLIRVVRSMRESFQSAAASWTRRNDRLTQRARSGSSFNPPPRRGRGGIFTSWIPGLLDAEFQSAAASWTRRNSQRPAASGQLGWFQSAAASWTRRNKRSADAKPGGCSVSIRRRVVDAAESA